MENFVNVSSGAWSILEIWDQTETCITTFAISLHWKYIQPFSSAYLGPGMGAAV